MNSIRTISSKASTSKLSNNKLKNKVKKNITTRSRSSSTTTTLSKLNKEQELKLNLLIPFYHQIESFSPLNNQNQQLNKYIIHNLIPKDKFNLRLPESLNLLQLTRNKNNLLHEIEKINSNTSTTSSSNTFLSSTEINLNTSLQSSSNSYNQELDPTYSNSYSKLTSTGSEPPLSSRIRRIMDTLHGTSAGGQAGLETVKELGPGIMKIELELQRERRREELEEEAELDEERKFNEGR